MTLPFLTLPDPKTSGEGALDPLGLGTIGDRLADTILPGFRVRMNRPRFLTVMAVAATVCEGLDDSIDSDTPAYLVFEWLLVEAFVRSASRELYRGTPGTLKAQAVTASGEVMSPRTYLRTPSVFGVHGVYKPLARHLNIAEEQTDHFRIEESGVELLKIWQEEQGQHGFVESYQGGPGESFRKQLREAVQNGMLNGFTKQSAGWTGWQRLATHLAPGSVGTREAAWLEKRFKDPSSGRRGELFRLLAPNSAEDDAGEADIAAELVPRCSEDLARHIQAIAAYESMARLVETAFDLIRSISTHAGARPIQVADFSATALASNLAAKLQPAIAKVDDALQHTTPEIQQLFSDLARYFDRVSTADSLFEAVLARHTEVQKAKPPEGKRDWFEREAGGATMVRPPYQLSQSVQLPTSWGRPYRLTTVQRFLADLTR